MSDITERLRAGCTDWNGDQMDGEAPPMDCLTAGDVREAAAEIERLRAQVAAMRENDARYRWLRESNWSVSWDYTGARGARHEFTILVPFDGSPIWNDENAALDAAIDRARESGGQG